MENKYIITLEEIPFERFHSYNVPSERLYRVQGFNSLVFDGNGLSKLTPYTEPDLEAIRKEVYAEGYKKGMQLSIDDTKLKESYQQGLSDAWECARKIALTEADGGIHWKVKEQWFGKSNIYNIFKDVPASEAIEKIRQHEQEQEEFKVWDEVNGKGGKGIITRISDDGNHFNVMWENGSTGYYMIEGFKKTGRRFSEIAEVLKKMQEG